MTSWRKENKPSIRGRFFTLVGLITILPIILIATATVVYTIVTDWHARLSSASVFSEQIQISTEKLMQPMDRLLLSYAADSNTMRIFTTVGNSFSNEELRRRRETVMDFLKVLSHTNEDIFNIEYNLTDGERFFSYNNFYSFNNEEIQCAAARLIEENDPYGVVMLMPEYQYLQAGTMRYAITLVRLLYDENNRRVGYGALMIKQRIFSSNLQSLTDNRALNSLGAQVLIYDGNKLFFQSDTGETIRPEELTILGNQLGGNSLTLSLGGKRSWAYTRTSAYTGLTTVVYLPYAWLYQRLSMAAFLFGGFLLLGIIILGLASRFFDKHIAQPLDHLSNIMIDSHAEHSADKDDGIVFQEIETLYNSYNAMVQQNLELQEKERKYRDNLASLEQLTLSTQINPHYFGNVLSMISARAYVDGMQDIVRICENMAVTFRYTFKSPLLVPLSAETEMIQQYVQILRDLYGRPLELYLEIDAGCEKWLLPKVTLQPLVENAVIHSILQKNGAERIEIRAFRQESIACIQVADDGAGMSAEQVEQLHLAMKEDVGQFLKREKRSIGLNTVHYRIIQHFGSQYGLTITSTPGEGTVVSIHLPVAEEE